MNFLEGIKNIWLTVLSLLFPIACLLCGKEDTYLCPQCLTQLPRLDRQRCVRCQEPSAFGKTHPACRTRNVADGSISALNYKDPGVLKIIKVFKYNFVSDLSKPLGSMIVEVLQNQELAGYFKDFTIVPVPLHSKRHNWRGFNQAELLSNRLAQALQIPLNSGLVARRKSTKPQVKLSAAERKKNLENAFLILQSPANQKILLVDDVITSGSTINELAKLLKKHKVAEVWAITVAHG